MKIRNGITQKARHFAKQLDLQETNIVQMSIEESWDAMPSYQDWLDGQRMPNQFIGMRSS